LQRRRETIDGVVRDGHGTVAALVAHFEPEIGNVFLADLEIVGDFLALGLFAPATSLRANSESIRSR